MAEEVPLPRDESSEEPNGDGPGAAGGDPPTPGSAGRTAGRRSDSSLGHDPWERQDPWSAGRDRGRDVRAPGHPGLESEFMQFLQWRSQSGAGPHGLFCWTSRRSQRSSTTTSCQR